MSSRPAPWGNFLSEMQSNVTILAGLQNRYQALDGIPQSLTPTEALPGIAVDQYRLLGASSEQGSQTLPDIDRDVTRLQGELEQARSRYTDEYPDVVNLQSQLDSAERQRRQLETEQQSAEKQQTKRGTSSADLQATSPMMQLESQLKANEQEIKDTQAEIKALEEQIRNYQGRLNVAPVREQQFTDLTRNYDQSKANYDSLLKKQMESQMATNLEKRQEGQRFQALDPPDLPRKPFWPDRMKFSLGGLGAGLALGLVSAFVIEAHRRPGSIGEGPKEAGRPKGTSQCPTHSGTGRGAPQSAPIRLGRHRHRDRSWPYRRGKRAVFLQGVAICIKLLTD